MIVKEAKTTLFSKDDFDLAVVGAMHNCSKTTGNAMELAFYAAAIRAELDSLEEEFNRRCTDEDSRRKSGFQVFFP